jgi:hypothetical protein
MEHPYSVRRAREREWIVSADGRDVLVCGRLCDALGAANEAAELLGRGLDRRNFRWPPPGLSRKDTYPRTCRNRSSACRLMLAATERMADIASAAFWPPMYARSAAHSKTMITAAKNKRIP